MTGDSGLVKRGSASERRTRMNDKRGIPGVCGQFEAGQISAVATQKRLVALQE
jgi:hypothetical protein